MSDAVLTQRRPLPLRLLIAAFLVTWPLRKWSSKVRVVGSVIVALAGLWWMFERIFSA